MAEQTTAPDDVMEIDPVKYELIGWSIQQTAASSTFWALHNHLTSTRSHLRLESAIPTIDDWNAHEDRLRGKIRQHDEMVEHGVEELPENVITPMENASRWKYIWDCTIQRNTTHWACNDGYAPYDIVSYYAYRMGKLAKNQPTEENLRKACEEAASQNRAFDADTLFKARNRTNKQALVNANEIGEEICLMFPSLEIIEKLPSDWEEQWLWVESGAAKSIMGDYTKSLEEIVNDGFLAFPEQARTI